MRDSLFKIYNAVKCVINALNCVNVMLGYYKFVFTYQGIAVSYMLWFLL